MFRCSDFEEPSSFQQLFIWSLYETGDYYTRTIQKPDAHKKQHKWMCEPGDRRGGHDQGEWGGENSGQLWDEALIDVAFITS